MGTQAMASQDDASVAGATNVLQQSHIRTLARQVSLYGLTLNEVESHLGESLLSMNLDELLRSVLPDDMDQMDIGDTCGPSTSTSGLQRQGSITMPPALSKKTVNEVWRGIQHGQESSNEEQTSSRDKHLSFGDITLEDFLLRAGVAASLYPKGANGLIGDVAPAGGAKLMTGAQDFSQGARPMDAYIMNHSISQPPSIGIGSMLDVVYPSGQLSISSSVVGPLSDPQTPGRKRISLADAVDKAADRRQKRMIKNRESAARSRARKQAYTNELESKLSRLEEENKRLKKEKELEKLLDSALPPEPKYQLRRMNSAAF